MYGNHNCGLMAERQQNLNQQAVPKCTPTSDFVVSVVIPDCLVLRFELADQNPLPQCANDLLFNSEMQEEAKGGDTCIPLWCALIGKCFHYFGLLCVL